MSSTELATETRRLRKANDWIDLKALRPPASLFDDFWREGELALLFGTAGVGKSLLAVQISDALARGRAIAGFEMSATPRRQVLYVDLVLSDEQWAMRYSREARGGVRRAYKFSAGLYRDRPLERRAARRLAAGDYLRRKDKRRHHRRPLGDNAKQRRDARNAWRNSGAAENDA